MKMIKKHVVIQTPKNKFKTLLKNHTNTIYMAVNDNKESYYV